MEEFIIGLVFAVVLVAIAREVRRRRTRGDSTGNGSGPDGDGGPPGGSDGPDYDD